MKTTVNKPDLKNFLEGLLDYCEQANNKNMYDATLVFMEYLFDENFLKSLSAYTKRQTDNPICFVNKDG